MRRSELGEPAARSRAEADVRPPGGTAARRTGRLAGLGARLVEVAHEIRVPLSLIVGSLETLRSYVELVAERVRQTEARGPGPLTDDPGLRHALEHSAALLRICDEGTARLERLVDEIAGYARGGEVPGSAGPVDLGRVLRTTAELVARASASAPPILFDLPGLPAVSADEAALGRVVVILLRNAFDALVGVEDAQVTVTAAVRMDVGACGPARWVEVAIGDNGPGVPPADRARVFEPFFTSKDVGAGLGLGLAIAKELVEAQGGSIALAPPAARGTTFLLRLPVTS